jgi:hypothetical protein
MSETQPRAEALFGDLILRLLAPHSELTPSLRSRIGTAVVRLLDSSMVIEDGQKPFRPLAPVTVRQDLRAAPAAIAVDRVLESIEAEGFAPHFHRFVGLLGAIMVHSCGNAQQSERVEAWALRGLTGAFMMSDPGGPSLDRWQSVARVDGPSHRLKIDKIWIIGGDRFDFAIVMMAGAQRMAPTAYLIGPEQCAAMSRRPMGPAFFESVVTLGGASGEVLATPDDLLRQGGPLGVSYFLCQARPRLVSAVTHHVHWLARQGRVRQDTQAYADLESLDAAAAAIRGQTTINRHSIDEVLALKFALNETLLEIACVDQTLSAPDQRDLLALTKMEGSSYRCLLEIYGRCKSARLG